MQLRFLLRFPFELTCESRDGVGVGGRAGGDLRRPEVFVDKVHSARKLRRLKQVKYIFLACENMSIPYVTVGVIDPVISN